MTINITVAEEEVQAIDMRRAGQRSGSGVGNIVQTAFDRVRIACERQIIELSELFQPHWYLAAYPDVAQGEVDPLFHYLAWGAAEGRDPSPMFQGEYYLKQYPNLDPATVNPLCHYIVVGEREGARPNPYFDPAFYEAQTGAVFGRRSALWHFSSQPHPAFDPSPEFSSATYLKRNPDVMQAGLNPLYHYLSSGFRDPWRMPTAESAASTPANVPDAAYRIDRLATFSSQDDVLVFVAFSPTGRLSRLQRRQIDAYNKAGYRVLLCVNAIRFEDHIDVGETRADMVIVRENVGFDFGAWSHVCRIVGRLDDVRSLSFTNDSIMLVGDAEGLAAQREAVARSPYEANFATRNLEVESHLQSYFFSLSRRALQRGTLDLIASLPAFSDKDQLIQQVEIKFEALLVERGVTCGPLYTLPAAEESRANPTIWHWTEMLDAGFPYLKIQLITAGAVAADDPRILERLGPELTAELMEHLAERSRPAEPAVRPMGKAEEAFYLRRLFNEYGAQTAVNPAPALARPIMLPIVDADIRTTPRVLAVVHCFYLDIAEQILDQIAALGRDFRMLLTTDTAGKAAALESLLRQRGLRGHAVVVPNRGRDVAPFLIECAKDAGDEELVLHLHTKKSPHDGRYAGWGEFLRENLIGSRAIVDGVFRLFEAPDVGMVYSEHFPEVLGLRNWGYDFEKARGILDRIGVRLESDMLLDFPTSTMFWARRSALRPLLDIGLAYADFDPEEGQIDGTLAHAIERTFLYVTESCGLRHLKVLSETQVAAASAAPIRLETREVDRLLKAPSLRLLGSTAARGHFPSRVGEIYPVNPAISKSRKPRFNVILPTLKPEKVYGGIATAVQTARDLFAAAGGDGAFDLRVLVTSDDVTPASLGEATRRLGQTVVLAGPGNDASGGATVVDLGSNRGAPLSLRAGDIFFATAWWTADLAFRLRDSQASAFGASRPVVYLIQDFEPGFYAWSDHYALADATYRQPDTLPIFNSEELANFMSERYAFSNASCIPFRLNERLDQTLKPVPKERIIICYGRPSTSRNCFAILVEGVRRWQERRPQVNTQYRVVFAGEPFDPGLIAEIENAEVAGKLSLDDYAALLSRTAIGVSLMVSPHPSYPPLEMASAGCVTITNNYENKDLSRRAGNILAMTSLNPAALADALDLAVGRVRIGDTIPRSVLSDIPTNIPVVNYGEIARLMLA